MNLDGTDLRSLKGAQRLGGSPTWSPDGTTIAVARSSPPGIWLMDADETNQRQLTTPLQKPDIEEDQDSQPAWSPDSARIAFVRSHEPHLGHTGTTRYRQDIYVVRADGSGLRKLTRLTDNNVSPTWSPDGKRILFASDRGHDDRYDIYVMNSDGTHQKRLTKTFDSVSPSWQPIP